MGVNLSKFMNLKFFKTIDLRLMRALMARHAVAQGGFDLGLLDGEVQSAREHLRTFFGGPDEPAPPGLTADLHRIAELGDGAGLQLLLEEARRQGIDLFGPEDAVDGPAAQARHDPKHVAIRTYLEHRDLFEAAADHRALLAPSSLAEFAGPECGVCADITDDKVSRFKDAIAKLFETDFRSRYCRLGPYEDAGEVQMVISHGSVVSTMPVVEEEAERVISIRAVAYAVLRYCEATGVLRLGGIPKPRQADIAELFAAIVLERPGFFAHADAQELYTLEPIERAGPRFAFEHDYNPEILKVLIVEAAADLFARDENGQRRFCRSMRSKAPSGATLSHLCAPPIRFGSDWRLGEIVVRVYFRTDAKRPSQVTVRLKPPGTLAFRRTRFEGHILTLLERNGLVWDRDAIRLIDAAE